MTTQEDILKYHKPVFDENHVIKKTQEKGMTEEKLREMVVYCSFASGILGFALGVIFMMVI